MENCSLKCRAKRTDTHDWIYGYYICLHHTTYCCKCTQQKERDNEIHQIVFEHMTDWCLPNQHLRADVDPATVCRCTGLLDQNHKNVFEGDILTCGEYPFTDSKGNQNYYAVVQYFDDSAAFGYQIVKTQSAKVHGIADGITGYLEELDISACRVIGNIFDNSELLSMKES